MFTARRFCASCVLILCLLGMILAQVAPDTVKQDAPLTSTSTVTASATAERVRFTAPGTVVKMQVEIFSESGGSLFNVGSKGNVFDWTLQDGNGQRVTEGSYLCVVTVKSLSGRISQRIGNVSVQGGIVTLKAAQTTQLTSAQQQQVGPLEENAGLTILEQGDATSATVVAHDGQDGQVTSTTGALTFRTGNVFAGGDKEQMRLTEEGNLGIGTDKPQAKLDVAGVIRTSKGIEFANGTDGSNVTRLTTTAAGGLQQTLADGTVIPNATGTGTQNKIAKWIDNAGTLGDSDINEGANGRVGIGTTNPGAKFHVIGVQGSIGGGTFQLDTATPFSSWTGAYPAFEVLNTNLTNNNVSLFQFSDVASGAAHAGIGAVSTNHASKFGDLFFFTKGTDGYQLRMGIYSGNVGIGTTAPTSVLHLVGAAPPPVSSGDGRNASPVLQVIGGNGGATNDLSVQSSGGKGGSVITQAGNGGSANEGEGGDGGDVITQSGNAGGGHTGGNGGQIRLQAGDGQGFNGNGGGITIQAGAGAANSGGGAPIFIQGGANGPNNPGFGPLKLQSAGGNVNIGDFSIPDFKLQVFDPSNKGLRVQTNSAGGTVASFGGNGDFQIDKPTSVAGRFVVKESGKVGIGKADPSSLLHVDAPSSGSPFGAMTIDVESFQTPANAVASHYFRVRDIGSAGASAFLIRGDGSVGIATDSPDHTLTVNGNADKPGGGSWDVFSDERLKTIKGSFTPGLKAVMQLQPLRYEYKPDNALGLRSSGEHIGFGAQAVQKIVPEAVTKNQKGYLLVNNDPILWTMLNAIKEQQKEIQDQQLIAGQQQQQLQQKHARIEKLEARLAALEKVVKKTSVRQRRQRQ